MKESQLNGLIGLNIHKRTIPPIDVHQIVDSEKKTIEGWIWKTGQSNLFNL